MLDEPRYLRDLAVRFRFLCDRDFFDVLRDAFLWGDLFGIELLTYLCSNFFSASSHDGTRDQRRQHHRPAPDPSVRGRVDHVRDHEAAHEDAQGEEPHVGVLYASLEDERRRKVQQGGGRVLPPRQKKKRGGVPGRVSLGQPGEYDGTIRIPLHADEAWAALTALPTPPSRLAAGADRLMGYPTRDAPPRVMKKSVFRVCAHA